MNNEQKSSIGGIGRRPYYDRHNDRVKGFFDIVIRDGKEKEAYEYVGEARRLKEVSGATRITLRMIASKDSIGMISQLMNTEALIPLNKEWKDYLILYLGENERERCTPPEVWKAEDMLLQQLLQNTQRRGKDEIFQRIRGNGYRIEILDKNISGREIREVFEIYREAFPRYTFPLTRENIRGLITSPQTLVAVARDFNDKIVSISVAEIASVETDLGELTISELSDEATLRAHRGRGLSQACILSLIDELYRMGIGVIYEEARATHIGVNKAAIRLGFNYGGRLMQHCVIGGDKEVYSQGKFEDLNVFYLPG